MDTDEKPVKAGEDGDAEMKDGEAATQATKKPKRRAEPPSERLQNYSRVTPAQVKYVTFPTDSRYASVRPVQGISGASGVDFQNTSSVALKGNLGGLLGNASPAKGGSGVATPLGAKESAATTATSKAGGATGGLHGVVGPSAEEARDILSSTTGSGAGILLLVDRKSSEPFRGLKVTSNGDDGGEGAQDGPADEDSLAQRAEQQGIDPADLAAIEAALAASEEDVEMDKKDIQSVQDAQNRGDGGGGGNNDDGTNGSGGGAGGAGPTAH